MEGIFIDNVKKYIAYMLIFLGIIGVAFAYNVIFQESPEMEVDSTGFENITPADEEHLDVHDALVESFEEKKELVNLDVELSDEVTWDASWGKIDLFHKSQRVRFHATGTYVTDLKNTSGDDIEVDDTNKLVTVTIPAPYIKSITIDETKNEYEDVSKGWLRFGEIKLTQDQYALMYNKVKEKMKVQLESGDYYSKAVESSRKSVRELFEELLNAIKADYQVIVKVDEAEKASE